MLQGLSELQQEDLAVADVKLSNTIVDVRKLQGGHGPLAKLIDFGMATHGTNCLCCLHVYCAMLLNSLSGDGGQAGGVDALHWGLRRVLSADSMASSTPVQH